MAEYTKIYYKSNKLGTFQLLKSPVGDVGIHLMKIGTKIKFAAKRQVGKNTGLLAASIGMSQSLTPTGQQVKIGSPVSYALIHHEGSRPHVIRANGGMLRFTSKGRIVYTRAVMHPGTRPNRYLSDHLWYVYK
jgi:hypothetical protein